MLSRRFVLGGLIAAPAVVAAGKLMPLRGAKYDPIVTLQTWPVGQEAMGEWWRHTGPLSRVDEIMREMKVQFGRCFWGQGQAGGNPAIQCEFTAPQEHVVSEFGVAHGEKRQDGVTPSAGDVCRNIRKYQDLYLTSGRIGFSSSGKWFLTNYATKELVDQMERKHDLATEQLVALRDAVVAQEVPCPPLFEPRTGRRRRCSDDIELPTSCSWQGYDRLIPVRHVSQEA